MKTRSPVLGYNHNVRYAGRLWHVQTEDSGVQNPRLFTHLFHEGTILATKRVDYNPELDEPAVQKLMQGQHKGMLRELKAGAFDEKISRFLGAPIEREARSDTDPGMDAVPAPVEITIEAEDGELDADTLDAVMEAEPASAAEEFGEAHGNPTNPRAKAAPTTDPGSLPPVMEPPHRATVPQPPPRPAVPPPLAPRSGVIGSNTNLRAVGAPPTIPAATPPAAVLPPATMAPPVQQVPNVQRPPEQAPPLAARPTVARPGAIAPPPANRSGVTGTPTSVRRPTAGVSSTQVRPPGTIGNAGGASRPVAPTRSAALGIGGRRAPGLATPYGGNKPTAEGVVVARPAVIVGSGVDKTGGTPNNEAPRASVSRWHQASAPTPTPTAAPERAGANAAADNIFGGDVISEKSLDEVILAYLSEDLSEGKK